MYSVVLALTSDRFCPTSVFFQPFSFEQANAATSSAGWFFPAMQVRGFSFLPVFYFCRGIARL